MYLSSGKHLLAALRMPPQLKSITSNDLAPPELRSRMILRTFLPEWLHACIKRSDEHVPALARLVQEGVTPTQTGDKVRFRIADIFLPTPDALLFASVGEGELEGTIINFSDSGQKARLFALVDVVRRQTVVVPVEKLKSVAQFGPERGP